MKTAIYNKVKRLALLFVAGGAMMSSAVAQENLHLFYRNGDHKQIEITDDTKVEFVKKTFLQFNLMYRMDIDYRLGTAGHGLQGTAVCNTKFLRDRLYFEGYVDLNYKATEERFQFSTELQLLYCFNRHFAAGTEVEIENYFTDVKVSPKMMLKYSF